jgi:hypothetical protein
VLESWPHIYAALQGNATLLVYYGFTEGFLRSNRRSPDGEQWLQYMQQLLRQPGVQYVGLVNHTMLATALASAGFVLYPTSYPETGCITLMKARHSFLCVCVDHGCSSHHHVAGGRRRWRWVRCRSRPGIVIAWWSV